MAKAMSMVILMMMMLTTLVIVPEGMADVFSSMTKMQQLASFERGLIVWMIENTQGWDDHLKDFLKKRAHILKQYADDAMHPNTAYLMIRTFLSNWGPILEQARPIRKEARSLGVELPTKEDLHGVVSAILMLQHVYNVSVEQVFSGNYMGYQGPALKSSYTRDLYRMSFNERYLDLSFSWLQLSVRELENSLGEDDLHEHARENYKNLIKESLALLGLIYIQKGDEDKAREMLAESSSLPGYSAETETLQNQLDNPADHENETMFSATIMADNIKQLCRRDRTLTVGRQRHYHTCRYKPSLLLPYLRYKEEMLSRHPYVTLFYDVISDSDIKNLTKERKKLKRAPMIHGKDFHGRITQSREVGDEESEVAARLSARISDMTWLDAHSDRNTAPTKASADPLRVVNYGISGHHLDHHESRDTGNATLDHRLATFMIYLSDTEIGGYTLFPRLNISIAPKKGMAVLWYNVKARGAQDPNTAHASCPVLKGNKWIVTKSIRSHGNMFRRPCGLSPKASHLEMEPLMWSRGRQTLLTS